LKRRVLRELVIALVAAAIGLGALLFVEAALHLAHGFTHAMDALRGILREWTRCSAESWIVLGLLSAALSYPARALLALRRRDPRTTAIAGELRVLAALGATSSALLVSTAMGWIYAGRGPEPSEPLNNAMFVAARLARELTMWSILGAGLVLLAALWGLVSVTWARRESRGSAARIVTIAGLVAAVLATGASLLAWWITVTDATFNAEWMDPEHRYELTVRTGDPLVQGRWVLLAVAAVAAAAILIAARREQRSSPSSRELKAGAGLFALGLLTFALTRSADHDARHPVPLWQPTGITPFSDARAASLPKGEQCLVLAEEAPRVELVDGTWLVDGVRAPTAAALADLLAAKKKLWTQVSPRKSFPGLVLASIPADAPMSLVRLYLQAARDVGYPELSVLETRPPRAFVTRTLGELAYRPRLCVVRVSQADALPTTGTWGDWARSLERAGQGP
jgi:hypothetical protein